MFGWTLKYAHIISLVRVIDGSVLKYDQPRPLFTVLVHFLQNILEENIYIK